MPKLRQIFVGFVHSSLLDVVARPTYSVRGDTSIMNHRRRRLLPFRTVWVSIALVGLAFSAFASEVVDSTAGSEPSKSEKRAKYSGKETGLRRRSVIPKEECKNTTACGPAVVNRSSESGKRGESKTSPTQTEGSTSAPQSTAVER